MHSKNKSVWIKPEIQVFLRGNTEESVLVVCKCAGNGNVYGHGHGRGQGQGHGHGNSCMQGSNLSVDTFNSS